MSAAVGALGMIPLVGSVLGSSLATAVSYRQRERDAEFWAYTAARVQLLEQQLAGFRFDPSDDEFVAATYRAGRAAQETADHEKRKLLAEAIVSAGSWSHVPLTRRERYLDLVARLSPDHIRLLEYLRSPLEWLKTHRPGAVDLVEATPSTTAATVIREHVFGGHAEAADAALHTIEDLVAERLLGMGLNLKFPGQTVLQSDITRDGAGLLDFLGELPGKLWETLD